MTYRMSTEMTEHQTRKQIVDEFRKWKDGWESAVGVYDFPPTVAGGESEALVRFVLRERPMELRCSSQSAYRDNLRCVFYAVQAMRMNEKRGIADTMANAYAQLAAPASARDPYEVLGVFSTAEPEAIEAAYRALAKKYHSDTGDKPDDEKMAEINDAIERVRADRNGS